MNCRQVRIRLLEYTEGLLNETDRRTIGEHVDTCDACGAELRRVVQIFEQRRKTRPASPSEHYWINLLPRIHEKIERRKKRRVWQWIPRYGFAAAAAALIALVIFRGGDETPDSLQQLLRATSASELEFYEELARVPPFVMEEVYDDQLATVSATGALLPLFADDMDDDEISDVLAVLDQFDFHSR